MSRIYKIETQWPILPSYLVIWPHSLEEASSYGVLDIKMTHIHCVIQKILEKQRKHNAKKDMKCTNDCKGVFRTVSLTISPTFRHLRLPPRKAQGQNEEKIAERNSLDALNTQRKVFPQY